MAQPPNEHSYKRGHCVISRGLILHYPSTLLPKIAALQPFHKDVCSTLFRHSLLLRTMLSRQAATGRLNHKRDFCSQAAPDEASLQLSLKFWLALNSHLTNDTHGSLRASCVALMSS